MESVFYRIEWPVPPTGSSAWAIVHTSVDAVEALTDDAMLRLQHLAKRCPAGGIMPEPQDGERWGLRTDDGVIHTNSVPHPIEGDTIHCTLVLIDARGEPYDHAELARIK